MKNDINKFTEEYEAKAPETYYDQQRKEYLVQDSRNNWMPLSETSYKRKLKSEGFSSKVDKNKGTSPIDDILLNVQHEHNIDYKGPLAGYKAGIREFGTTRILVTSSPKIIDAAEGDWSTLRQLMVGLLGEEQFPYFCGWLKIAYDALLAGQIRPGQVVVLCGPHGCGKSLLQNLVTEILGGRSAKPYQNMRGGTEFNADLFGAEHLMIEDEQPARDIRSRRAFGAAIKNMSVSETQRLHPKGKDAITLEPFWRVTVSLNDEDENILVLPPLDDSIKDKMMLFKVAKCAMPMATRTLKERKAFRSTLTNDIPGFLHHLTNWNIPESMQCDRYGVLHYHHHDIISVLDTLSPEKQLLNLIDTVLFPELTENHTKPHKPFEKTAYEIQQWLTNSDCNGSYEARNLLKGYNYCANYLGRLAKSYPDRVENIRTSTKRLWRITPPE